MTILSQPSTRRRFLGATSAVMAGLALGLDARPLRAAELASRRPASTLYPEALDTELMRRMARAAVDAAVAAGASFADVRLSEGRSLMVGSLGGIWATMGFERGFGIRVCVDGAWGFGYGVDPTPDSIAATARAVTHNLKTMPAAWRGVSSLLAPVPPATGVWETPVRIDPFDVSPDDHVSVISAYADAVKRVYGTRFYTNFSWLRETRVFASSEGALTTQSFMSAQPMLWERNIDARDPNTFRDGDTSWSGALVTGAASAGFEVVVGSALQERFVTLAEDAVRWSSYPTVLNYPVGRYDVVLDGSSMGALLGEALTGALSLDRAIGRVSESEEASVLSPVSSVLGKPVFSKLLTVTADRTAPHLGAAKWDDEGVPSRAVTLVQDGTVRSYLGTRSAAALAAANGEIPTAAAGLTGSAVAPMSTRVPAACASSIRMTPASSGPSLGDLIASVDSGVVVRLMGQPSMTETSGHGMSYLQHCYEVKRGKVTRRILYSGLQFSTKRALSGLAHVGGAQTEESGVAVTWIGQPRTLQFMTARAPAVILRDATLIDLNQGGAGW